MKSSALGLFLVSDGGRWQTSKPEPPATQGGSRAVLCCSECGEAASPTAAGYFTLRAFLPSFGDAGVTGCGADLSHDDPSPR